MKDHARAKVEYEGLLAFAEEFAGVPMNPKQKRMARALVYTETFNNASPENKKVVLAFAALYYSEQWDKEKG